MKPNGYLLVMAGMLLVIWSLNRMNRNRKV
ncbi:MAG: hypothetical protein ACFWUA_09160 [Sporanaerobacter sp.]|jgi:hypothetical protein